MYTWGYIKEATLAKMDLTVEQAINMNLINKMPFYANEAITQITSSIKAKRTYTEYKIRNEAEMLKYLMYTYNLDDMSFLYSTDTSMLTDVELTAYNIYYSYSYENKPLDFPNDFFAWSDDIVYKCKQFKHANDTVICDYTYKDEWIEASDFDYVTYGGNKVIFKHSGDYRFPYLAKWFKILPTTNDNFELDCPDDILDALPSYIASQLYKIDDETKSAILRNEYEMAIARIDENDYSTNKTIVIGGNW